MTREQYRRLEAEWNARLRADGFQDIEAPSGLVARPLSHGVSPARTRRLAQLEQDREATPRLRFGEPWERKAWELHCDGMSAREIARRLCLYRKIVDQAFTRLHAQMNRPRRGRKRDPESLRSEGLALNMLLSPVAALALDHCHQVLKVSKAEAVRRAIVELARKTSGPSQGSGANPPYNGMTKAA